MKRYLFLFLFLTGCIDESAVIADCQPVGGKVPLCGWQSPEDMELLPDGRTLLVSEMEQNHGEIVGRLSLLETESSKKTPLDHASIAQGDHWGDSQCQTPPGDYLAPHGVHLSQRTDQAWQLLVVNHGEREAVEFYELKPTAESYRLAWRGCVEMPEGSFLNDVVALPDGGFVATHMYGKPDAQVGTMSWPEAKALLGFNPGYLLHWDKKSVERVSGFSGSYPNGLQISRDAKTLFINLWAGSKVVKFNWAQRQVVGEVEVLHPDNSQWNGRGSLWVASHDFSLGDLRLCLRDGTKACPGTFRVMELEPDTMEVKEILFHKGAPMGAGTVAQRVGDNMFVGSFLGDRILRVPYSEAK